MSVTSLKLPDELKKRIAAAAESAGKSPHAFMVEALERQTRAAEKRQAFVQDALSAREELYRTGVAFDAEEVHRYVKAKAAGKKVSRPKARAWRK